jgi:hypothetical protein
VGANCPASSGEAQTRQGLGTVGLAGNGRSGRGSDGAVRRIGARRLDTAGKGANGGDGRSERTVRRSSDEGAASAMCNSEEERGESAWAGEEERRGSTALYRGGRGEERALGRGRGGRRPSTPLMAVASLGEIVGGGEGLEAAVSGAGEVRGCDRGWVRPGGVGRKALSRLGLLGRAGA